METISSWGHRHQPAASTHTQCTVQSTSDFQRIESRNIKCNVNFICQIYSDLFVDVVVCRWCVCVRRICQTVSMFQCDADKKNFEEMMTCLCARSAFAPLTENWENSNCDAKRIHVIPLLPIYGGVSGADGDVGGGGNGVNSNGG